MLGQLATLESQKEMKTFASCMLDSINKYHYVFVTREKWNEMYFTISLSEKSLNPIFMAHSKLNIYSKLIFLIIIFTLRGVFRWNAPALERLVSRRNSRPTRHESVSSSLSSPSYPSLHGHFLSISADYTHDLIWRFKSVNLHFRSNDHPRTRTDITPIQSTNFTWKFRRAKHRGNIKSETIS